MSNAAITASAIFRGAPDGTGSPGPTSVVDELFRLSGPPDGWRLADEVDTMVVVRRDR